MKYENIKKGIFLNRPNRFIAEIEVDGKREICHVKNTGRCREILISGAEIYVEENNNPKRKTKFDLISVKKGDRLINIDSQAPNKAAFEWLKSGGLGRFDYIKPEKAYGSSRVDFYGEMCNSRIFIEVKGVTLENGNIVSFPDAPTLRGTKHLGELMRAVEEGYKAYVLFVVQMKNVLWFEPNYEHDPKFSEELYKAYKAGVKIIAYDCDITKDEMVICDEVSIKFRR